MQRPAAMFASAASRSFHVSPRARGQGETDNELSAKLKEEIHYEKEAAAELAGKEPEFIQEFKNAGIWQIEAKTGNDEVVLSRKFGNETIRVLFSIAEIENPAESQVDEDGNPIENEDEPAFPVRCAITITKPTGGALSVDCNADNGAFVVDNISYYADSTLATDLTAEADWKRRGLYVGPQFEQLDAGVQESFERYLEERGIGPTLAMFIPDYVEFKEQQEYTKWLQNVDSFVSA
jgi:complement component 1 Q subcomponent-binding protein